jgi:hypothetical protein
VLAPIKCGLQLHWFHAGESIVGSSLFQLFFVMARNPAREDGCKHAILQKTSTDVTVIVWSMMICSDEIFAVVRAAGEIVGPVEFASDKFVGHAATDTRGIPVHTQRQPARCQLVISQSKEIARPFHFLTPHPA